MTRKQAEKKVRELIQRTAVKMREDLDSLLRSGGVPLDDYEDDYRLPKAIMTALCLSAAGQWRPLTPDHTQERLVKDFAHFI